MMKVSLQGGAFLRHSVDGGQQLNTDSYAFAKKVHLFLLRP